MTDLLPRPELCWADATIISNYEAATLPLLYAPEDDCKQYFQAMKRKNPRKGLGLEAVFALCLEARRDKDDGNYMGTLRKLLEGAERRAQLFHIGDYQVVAAYEHCVWTAIHLGVLELSSTKASAVCAASTLFSFGSDVLRVCRNAQRPLLSGFVVGVLEFALNYNWSCYFAHRYKWHAAAHHALVAEQKWGRVSTASTSATSEAGDGTQLSDFVVLRRLMVEERLGESLPRVKNELQQLRLRGVAADGAADDGKAPAEEPTVSTPSLFTIQVAAEEESRELTVCLSAARPQNAWDAPLGDAIPFLTTYTLAMCDHSLKLYSAAQTKLQAVGLLSTRGNPSWDNNVLLLQRLCASKDAASSVIAQTVQPMPLDMTRSSGLRVQRLLKNYLLSQRSRKQRLRAEQALRQHLIDEGADEENDPEFDTKWRIPPTTEESEGLLTAASKHSASVAAFASMFPLLQNRTGVREALKVLEASNTSIVSPADVLRESAAVSATQRQPSPSVATRPATVEPLTAAELAEYNASRHSVGQARPSSTPPCDNTAPGPKPSSVSQRTRSIYGVASDGTQRRAHTSASGSLMESPDPPSHIALDEERRETKSGTPSRKATIATRRTTDKSMSVEDRTAMLSEAAREWVVGASERSIKLQSQSYRSSADAMRCFAASLVAMADALTAKASVLEAADKAGLDAATAYASMSVSREEMVSPAAGDTTSPTRRSPSPPLVAAVDAAQSPGAFGGADNTATTQPVAEVVDMETLRRKQRQLRALLPTIDHHCTAYRMVVHELAENEAIMQQQRNAEKIAKLARDAEMGAARRASLAFNPKSFNTLANATTTKAAGSGVRDRAGAADADGMPPCGEQELLAIGWWLGLSLLPLSPATSGINDEAGNEVDAEAASS